MENKVAKFVNITGIVYVVLSIIGSLFIFSEVSNISGISALFISLGFSLVFFGGAELIELNDKQFKELVKINNNSSKSTSVLTDKISSQITFQDLPEL